MINYSLLYKHWHSDTEESKQTDIKEAIKMIKLHNLLPEQDAEALEIGCGMGRFMLAIKQMGVNNITGVDIEPTLLEIAKKESLSVINQDAIEFLKNNNDMYDAIYCFDIVEHLDINQQGEFFSELFNHLKENGFVTIKTVNALSPTASFFRYNDFTHKNAHTPETITFLAQNAGFKEIIVRPDIEESQELQELKIPFAEIYRKQFFMKNVILTPNIIAVLFKNSETAGSYIKNTPKINNNYEYNPNDHYDDLVLKDLLKYYLSKFINKLSFGKINLFGMKNISYKYYIHKKIK